MKLVTGIVISSVKAPNVYNEIVKMYSNNGKKMVEVSQFSKEDDDKTILFYERELMYMLRNGSSYVVNNWERKN